MAVLYYRRKVEAFRFSPYGLRAGKVFAQGERVL